MLQFQQFTLCVCCFEIKISTVWELLNNLRTEISFIGYTPPNTAVTLSTSNMYCVLIIFYHQIYWIETIPRLHQKIRCCPVIIVSDTVDIFTHKNNIFQLIQWLCILNIKWIFLKWAFQLNDSIIKQQCSCALPGLKPLFTLIKLK